MANNQHLGGNTSKTDLSGFVLKDGKVVTDQQYEQLLLKQLETHQRPDNEILWDLARLYNEAGRKAEALARIKQLASMAPTLEEKAKCFLNMGRLMEQMHDFEMAIKYYSVAPNGGLILQSADEVKDS